MGAEARRLVYPEEGFGAPGSSCIVVKESVNHALANLHGLLPASARFWPSGLLDAPSDLAEPDDATEARSGVGKHQLPPKQPPGLFADLLDRGDRALANLHGMLPASARFWGAPSALAAPDDAMERPAKRLCATPQGGEAEE